MTYINIPNKIFNSSIDEYIQESHLAISSDDQMAINQFKYTRESNGVEHYNFVYPEAEIQRNEIQKQ